MERPLFGYGISLVLFKVGLDIRYVKKNRGIYSS